jgi:ribosomal protein L40E
MSDRWICSRCYTSADDALRSCPNCGSPRGLSKSFHTPDPPAAAAPKAPAPVPATPETPAPASDADQGRATPPGTPMAAAATGTSERWVCLRCFASNDGSATTCSNCGLERGVDPAAGATGEGGVGAPAIPQASQGGGFPWRWVIYGVIALLVVGGSVLFAARRDDTGAISDAGDMSVFDLKVGDCFDVSADATEVETVRAIPCAEPHIYELFWAGDYPSDTLPSETEYSPWVEDRCFPAFAEYVGIDYNDSIYFMGYFSPTEESWSTGDREFACYLSNEFDTAISGSARGTAQ